MKLNFKRLALNTLLTVITATVAIAIGTNLPHFIAKWRGPIRSGNFSEHIEKLPYRLTLYGTSTCPHCQSARMFLKQAGVDFNDLVLDQTPSLHERFKQLNEKGVPVLVSDHKLVVGFDANVYTEIIKNTKQK